MMSLGKQMTEWLRLLATQGPNLAELQSYGDEYKGLSVSDAGQEARLEFFDHDRYSVTLRALQIGGGAPKTGEAQAYLSARAAEVARRLSYLEEPLAVWELDGSLERAELRSSPPQREGDEISYWEVTLWAGEQPGARIARYRWAPGMIERELIAYPATIALVARMADSLAEALRTAAE
jgi:hypothetical protein